MFYDTLVDVGVDKSDIDAIISINMKKFKTDVVTAKPKAPPVFELIGGKETVMKFVPLFYKKVIQNEQIAKYLTGTCKSA